MKSAALLDYFKVYPRAIQNNCSCLSSSLVPLVEWKKNANVLDLITSHTFKVRESGTGGKQGVIITKQLTAPPNPPSDPTQTQINH